MMFKKKKISLTKPGWQVIVTYDTDHLLLKYPSNHKIDKLIKIHIPDHDRMWMHSEKCWRLKVTKKTMSFVTTTLPREVGEEVMKYENEEKVEQFKKRKFTKIVVKGSGCRIFWGIDVFNQERDLFYRNAINTFSFELEGKKREGGLLKDYTYTTCLYDIKTDTFPVGLLRSVQAILGEIGIPHEVVDKRTVVSRPINVKYHGHELRGYQTRAVRAFLKAEIGTIQVPTGGGKTLIGIYCLTRINEHAIVFVHRKELVMQWVRNLIEHTTLEPGDITILAGNASNMVRTLSNEIGDEAGDIKVTADPDNPTKVVVAMLQTTHRRLTDPKKSRTMKEFLNNYNLIIVDEAHHVPASTVEQVMKHCDARYRMGLSATPWRNGTDDIIRVGQVGNVIYVIDPEDLIKDGFLARPVFLNVSWDEDGVVYRNVLDEFRAQTGEYYMSWRDEQSRYIASRERCQAIALMASSLHKRGHRVFVDVHLIKIGKTILKELRKMGIPCEFLSGSDPVKRREEVLENFQNGSDRLVLISTLLGEGVDLPTMTAIIFARGGKSSIATIQTIGRVLRPKHPENEAIVVNMIDSGKYSSSHSNQRMMSLEDYYGKLYSPRDCDLTGFLWDAGLIRRSDPVVLKVEGD